MLSIALAAAAAAGILSAPRSLAASDVADDVAHLGGAVAAAEAAAKNAKGLEVAGGDAAHDAWEAAHEGRGSVASILKHGEPSIQEALAPCRSGAACLLRNTSATVVEEVPAIADVPTHCDGSTGCRLENSNAGTAVSLTQEVVPDLLPRGEVAELRRPDDTGGNSFDYHKPLFPIDWNTDGLTMLLASLGLVIAASGGIGGGGILVPLFLLQLGFKPKHAIALSNFTILGGAIANTAVNTRKRHPELDRHLIDWDLILIMEPLTIFGAVLGSLLSKVLPNAVLTTLLVMILALMGHRTMTKAIQMWHDETRALTAANTASVAVEMITPAVPSAAFPGVHELAADESGQDRPYLELQSEGEEASCEPGAAGRRGNARQSGQRQLAVGFKVAALTCCFAGTILLTVLKGGGNFPSPLGFDCGSTGFWALYLGACPWVFGFAVWFRNMLMTEHHDKLRQGYCFTQGEVQWTAENTIRYPAICALSGLMAGLFGVGGGIVKGPLMLEMGIIPSVASATAAAMILFTSAAATVSFVVFGLLHPSYGVLFFVLGFVSTNIGQYGVGKLAKKHGRQSPIVLSIGSVICLSAVLVLIDTIHDNLGLGLNEVLRTHGVCTAEA